MCWHDPNLCYFCIREIFLDVWQCLLIWPLTYSQGYCNYSLFWFPILFMFTSLFKIESKLNIVKCWFGVARNFLSLVYVLLCYGITGPCRPIHAAFSKQNISFWRVMNALGIFSTILTREIALWLSVCFPIHQDSSESRPYLIEFASKKQILPFRVDPSRQGREKHFCQSCFFCKCNHSLKWHHWN